MSASVVAAGSLAACMFALWLVSLPTRNSSLVDLYWGPAAFQVVAVCAALAPATTARVELLLAMVGVWALRLAVYLARRNLGHGEDARYTAMRRQHGDAWAWRSLFIVFGLQGVLVWVVTWPVRDAIAAAAAAPLGLLDLAGVALWATGFLFEAVGDAQLARFKADPSSKGQVMDRGLWRYTRHPNYFGEVCMAWALYGVALAGGAPAWTAGAPVLMTVLLVKVSGVSLLESTIGQRRPGYADYVKRTSALIPWPPRRPAPHV
jgi:steroid 5-alpha reductase family enzyme